MKRTRKLLLFVLLLRSFNLIGATWTSDSTIYKRISVQRENEIKVKLQLFKECQITNLLLEDSINTYIRKVRLQDLMYMRQAADLARAKETRKKDLAALKAEKEAHEMTRKRAENYKNLLNRANWKIDSQKDEMANMRLLAGLKITEFIVVGAAFSVAIIYFTNNDPF